MPGQCPSFTSESLWQTPQACTLIRIQSAGGSGIGRSTISNGPPATATWATRILLAIKKFLLFALGSLLFCLNKTTEFGTEFRDGKSALPGAARQNENCCAFAVAR